MGHVTADDHAYREPDRTRGRELMSS
jgi:hypothetical protein